MRDFSRSSLAIVDVGSSSIKWALYDLSDARPRLLRESDAVATHLGRGLAVGGSLSPRARRESLEAVAAAAAEIDALGGKLVRVVATEAVRRTRDREAFLDELRRRVGPGTEVSCIDGLTEAAYALISAERSLGISPGEALSVDPGGSSNDFAGRDAEGRVQALSLRIGMNDLTALAPPGRNGARLDAASVETIEAFAREAFGPAAGLAANLGVRTLVATSGAAISLGAVLRRAPAGPRQDRSRTAHGARVTRGHLDELIDATAALDAEGRRALHPSLTPVRSRIFVHGAVAFRALLDRLGLDGFVVNGYGMKFGGLVSAIEDRRRREGQKRGGRVPKDSPAGVPKRGFEPPLP